jgi:hypothetical protein
VVATDGHSYERADIEKWITKKGTSPITREPLTKEGLLPNRQLRKLVEQVRKEFAASLGREKEASKLLLEEKNCMKCRRLVNLLEEAFRESQR